MSNFRRWIESICSTLGAASAVLIGVMMFFITAHVFLRYAFHKPIPQAEPIAGLVLVVVVFLAVAHAQVRRAHIGVRLLVERLSRRVQRILQTIVLFISLGVFSVMIWHTTAYALSSFKTGEEDIGVLDIPLGPFRLAIPIGLALMCIVFIIQLVSHLKRSPLEQEEITTVKE